MTTHPRPGPELEKAEREAAEWERFRLLAGQIEAVNETICDARPPLEDPAAAAPGPEGQKGRLSHKPVCRPLKPPPR